MIIIITKVTQTKKEIFQFSDKELLDLIVLVDINIIVNWVVHLLNFFGITTDII